jgi:hypothetical protein
VEQSPPQSTSDAIQPVTEALVKKELLCHEDSNVRVVIATCISEITRITAPNAPYDDDAMKIYCFYEAPAIMIFFCILFSNIRFYLFPGRVFAVTVFFGRLASVLDTVAKVRSCVVMLDLECDGLINYMFQHFAKTIW